jgi:hypothetical protein
MSERLFVAIRRGKVKPGMTDEFAKRVKDGALSIHAKDERFSRLLFDSGS